MAKCEICNKGPQFGHNRSHAMNATNRMFKPNIQKRNLIIEGKPRKVKICTRCIRTLEKRGKLQVATG